MSSKSIVAVILGIFVACVSAQAQCPTPTMLSNGAFEFVLGPGVTATVNPTTQTVSLSSTSPVGDEIETATRTIAAGEPGAEVAHIEYSIVGLPSSGARLEARAVAQVVLSNGGEIIVAYKGRDDTEQQYIFAISSQLQTACDITTPIPDRYLSDDLVNFIVTADISILQFGDLIDNLQGRLNQCESDLATCEARRSELEDENARLKVELDDCKKRVDELEKELEALRNQGEAFDRFDPSRVIRRLRRLAFQALAVIGGAETKFKSGRPRAKVIRKRQKDIEETFQRDFRVRRSN